MYDAYSNELLNGGFMTPFIIFNFSAGSITQIPPNYFVSFNQDRTCDAGACKFTLRIVYAPNTFEAGTPDIIHQLLGASIHDTVTYSYGYTDSKGRTFLQRDPTRDFQTIVYSGIFTTYTEDCESGYLSYTIQGISHMIDFVTQEVTMPKFYNKKPSEILRLYMTHPDYYRDLFVPKYNFQIDSSDTEIKFVDGYTGPSMEYILGKVQSDNSIQGGIVNLGYSRRNTTWLLTQGFINEYEKNVFDSNYLHAMSSYGGASAEIKEQIQSAYNKVDLLSHVSFVGYFDNIVDGNKLGTFYYHPVVKIHDSGETFVYEYGNNIANSNVLSFSCSYDGSKFLASCKSTGRTSSGIDVDGNTIASTQISTESAGISRNTYSTLSGFNEEVFMTRNVLTQHLLYPFDATLTVLGQIYCSKLMSNVNVIVLINGTQHPVLTGKYTIIGIEDNLSDSGYTTTLKLKRCNSDGSEITDGENLYATPQDGVAGNVNSLLTAEQ